MQDNGILGFWENVARYPSQSTESYKVSDNEFNYCSNQVAFTVFNLLLLIFHYSIFLGRAWGGRECYTETKILSCLKLNEFLPKDIITSDSSATVVQSKLDIMALFLQSLEWL